MRNNKIMVDSPHTHPEGLLPNPEGILTHFKGSKWLQTWAWIWGKGLPNTTIESTHEVLHKWPKQGQDLNQRLNWHQWQTQDSNKPCKAQTDQQSLPLWHQWQRVAGWKKLDAEEEWKLKLMKALVDDDGSWRRVSEEDHVHCQSTKKSANAQTAHAKTIHTTRANISTQVAHKYQVPLL